MLAEYICEVEISKLTGKYEGLVSKRNELMRGGLRRINLCVEFKMKKYITKYGISWDPVAKVWFVYSDNLFASDLIENYGTRGDGLNKTIYLNVPFEDKDFAKDHNARWNPEYKAWCVSSNNPCHKMLIKRYGIKEISISNTDIFLDVPFLEKDVVKSNGAKFSHLFKSWYINENNQNFEMLIKRYGKQNTECDVCYTVNKQVNLPNCSHKTCINCFKKLSKCPFCRKEFN